jgi:hypothetical protein
MKVDGGAWDSHTLFMVRSRAGKLACFGLGATLAVAAHAGGPRGGAVVVTGGGAVAVTGGGAVTVTGGGGAVFGRPIVGVFPTAPAAIAPSFRNSTFPRTFFPGPRPVVAGAVPVYVGPPAYYDPWLAGAPQVAYAAAPQSAVPPAPPPPERQVEYQDGRYELRGDGVSVPYRWVWVPNPPPAPPASASKPGPDVRLYAWTDEQGVIHVTDRLDRIPERHRAQAKRDASS